MRRGIRGLVIGAMATAILAGCGDTVIQVQAPTSVARSSQALFPYRVPSGSMAPTIPLSTVVFAQREDITPEVGHIVLFHPPEGAEQETCGSASFRFAANVAPCDQPVAQESDVYFIKRIVAGPGDTIYISEGHVFRKPAGESSFTAESDSYIRPCAGVPECVDFTKPITIPAGEWFMMGDNRGESDDSRFWGPVPTAWITGEVLWCSTIGHPCE